MILASSSSLYFGVNFWNTFGVRAIILGVIMFVGLLLIVQGIVWHTYFVKSLPIVEAKGE